MGCFDSVVLTWWRCRRVGLPQLGHVTQRTKAGTRDTPWRVRAPKIKTEMSSDHPPSKHPPICSFLAANVWKIKTKQNNKNVGEMDSVAQHASGRSFTYACESLMGKEEEGQGGGGASISLVFQQLHLQFIV